MSDSRKQFDHFIFSKSGQSLLNGLYDRSIGGEHLAYQVWLECQKLNDSRINTLNDAITEDKILESHNRKLLAVIAKKDEALKAAQDALDTYDYTGTNEDADKYIKAERLCAEAIAFRPGDIALVEVGDFEVREDKQGTRYPRSSMSIGYDEFTVGVNHRLFVLQKKEGK